MTLDDDERRKEKGEGDASISNQSEIVFELERKRTKRFAFGE